MMQALPVMFTLWLFVAIVFAGLMLYRAYLTQHETDQLFLNEDESVDFNHAEHDDIVRNVDRLRPFCQGFGGATVLITAGILGIFLYHALPYVKF